MTQAAAKDTTDFEPKPCQKWAMKCLYSEELTLAGELRTLLRAAAAEAQRAGPESAAYLAGTARLHTVSTAITRIQSTLLEMTRGRCEACRNCKSPIEIGNLPGDFDYLDCPALQPTLMH